MKIALQCLVVVLMLTGISHAQEPKQSFQELMSQTLFSSDTVSIDVSKARGNQWVPVDREPTFTKEKLTRPDVILGLGLVATGAILAATASETATVTTFNPITQEPITTTVTATNNGRRWVGIGLLGSGGLLTYLGLSK